jgi:phosphatidyl-myo-inositol dimannoside synthase
MGEKTVRRSCNRIVALFPALLGVGGVQEAGRLTAAGLAQIASSYGWSVDFLSLNDSPGRQTFRWNSRDIPFRAFGRAKARFVLSAMIGARREARVAFAAHPHLAMAAAQMKLLQPRLKMAVISHGVEVWQPLPALRRKAFLKADVFLAPSSYTVEQIIQVQGAERAKTKCVPWPLNPDFLELSEKPEALAVPSDFPKGLVVLAATRLAADERYKGVDLLIQAVAQLLPKVPSLYLVVVGTGDDLPRHQEMARRFGVSERVRFLQGLSSPEIAGCYSRCDIFALPSTGEGFGFVFLEAMAFGKPVLGAAAGGVTDIIRHEQNGLLASPNDFGQLVRSLDRLLTSKSLRFELGRKGAEIVRSKFQFDSFRGQLECILRDCDVASENHP